MSSGSMALSCLAMAALSHSLNGQADVHPLSLDRTGIEWTYPFEKAVERSRSSQRLLLIKPIAFGTTLAGDW